MAVTATPIYPQAPVNFAQTFVAADTTSVKTLVTAGANGSQVKWLQVSNTDGYAHSLHIYLNDGTTDYHWGIVSIPASAGLEGIAPVDLLAELGQSAVELKIGWKINAKAVATLPAAQTVTVVGQGADY